MPPFATNGPALRKLRRKTKESPAPSPGRARPDVLAAPGQVARPTTKPAATPVRNKNGSVSTVRSITVTEGQGTRKRAVLLPTVVRGKVVSDAEAKAEYRRTGRHLGKFETEADATRAGQKLHRSEARRPDVELASYGFVGASERANARALQQSVQRLVRANRMNTARAEPIPKPDLTLKRNSSAAESLGGAHIPIVSAAARDSAAIIEGLPKVPYEFIRQSADPKNRHRHLGMDPLYNVFVKPNIEFGKQLATDPIGTFSEYPVSSALFGLAVIEPGASAAARIPKFARASGGFKARLQASRMVEPRYLRGVQFPNSPSAVTRAMQRGYDRFSETRIAESEAGRRMGPVSPSASVRVAKQQERHFRQEGRRTDAEYQRDVDYLEALQGPDRQAAFWSRQVPNSVRDEGLLKLEQTNRAMAQQARTAAQDELAKPAPNARVHAKHVTRAADLLRTAEEIRAARARPHDLRAEEAIGRLMDHRTEILTDAGKVKPGHAAEREGLLARELGYDDAQLHADLQDQRSELVANLDDMEGGELRAAKRDLAKIETRLQQMEGRTLIDDFETAGFVGHRSPGRTLLQRTLGRGTDVSTGTPLPRGVGHRNELKLFGSGRINADPAQIVKDWRAARVYEYHNNVRRYLGGIGERIDPEKGLKRGYAIVNPEGKGLPRHYREADPADLARGEGVTPELYADVETLVKNYLPDLADARRLMREFPDSVRQVPEAVVRRLAGHYDNVLTGKRPGRVEAATDIASDLVRASFIQFNPGYVPANLIGNAAFLAMGEGVRGFANLRNSARLRTKVFPKNVELAHRIRAEVGQGPTAAATSGGRNPVSRALHYAANVIGEIPDVQPRIASWQANARKFGLESDEAQLQLLRGAAQGELSDVALANEIRDRMNVNMVDFDRSGPTERYLGRKFGFVYPWVRGASRYPFRFAADHPIRSAVFANAATEQDAQHKLPYVPRWLEGSFKVGPQPGGDLARVVNPRLTSTVSTPMDVVRTLGAALKGGQGAALADLGNPVVGAAARAWLGRSRFGQDVGAGGSLWEFVQNASPAYNLGKELVDPGSAPEIYGPQSRFEVLRRRLGRGAIPMQIDTRAAWKRGRDEVGPVDRVAGDWHFFNKDLKPLLPKLGLTTEQVEPALKLAAARNAARAQEHERLGRKLESKEAIAVDYKTAVRLGLMTQEQADAALEQIAPITDPEILGQVTARASLFFGGLVLSAIRRASRTTGTKITEPSLVR